MRWAKLAYIALGVGLLALVLRDGDLAQTWDLMAGVGIAGIAAVVAIYALSFLGDSISWSLIVTSLPACSLAWWRRFFLVRLAGEAFNNIVPAAGFGGEPLKATILKNRYGIRLSEGTASIVMARTVNMIALIVFLLVGFWFVATTPAMTEAIRTSALAGLILLAVGTALLFAAQRLRLSSKVMGWFSGARWAERLAGLFAAVEAMDDRFAVFYGAHPARLSASLVLALANWILGVAEIYVTFLFLDHPISWREAWMIEALVQMVRSAAFFIPLAIGAQEGVFVLVVGAITGVPPLGLACAAVKRVRELLWIGLGVAVAAAYPTTPKR